MKQWFQKLTRREQLIVSMVAVLLGWFVLYSIAWAPVSNALVEYQSSNESAQETLTWMRQAVTDIERSRGSSAELAGAQSISALLDSTLPEYNLVMKRYQPTGDDSAQLWLEDAALPEVIAWLVSIERDYGMRLVNVSIASSSKEGRVKTRVRMAKP